MFHIAAFVQSIDPANALTAINAAREEQFFTNGVDFRIPAGLNKIIGVAGAGNDATLARAQVQSPSLRIQTNLDVEPIVVAANLTAQPEATTMFPDNPVELVEDEAMNFAVLSDPAAATIHAGLVWLADGPIAPASGKIFTLRATAAIAQNTVAWVNGNLTLGQVLPAGEYAVVGARFRSSDALAMRLVFSAQVARPGLSAIGNTLAFLDHRLSRMGKLGVWGQFPNTIPPTLDVIGGAAASQVVLLDLIRVA